MLLVLSLVRDALEFPSKSTPTISWGDINTAMMFWQPNCNACACQSMRGGMSTRLKSWVTLPWL